MFYTLKFPPDQRKKMAALFRKKGWARTCSAMGVSPTTLYRILREEGVDLEAQRREKREEKEKDRLERLKGRQMGAKLLLITK